MCILGSFAFNYGIFVKFVILLLLNVCIAFKSWIVEKVEFDYSHFCTLFLLIIE